MFKDRIRNPIDPIPFEYVNTLKRLEGEPDFSLTCLGIALLKPRIADYQGIDGVYYTLNYESECIEDFIRRYDNLDGYPMLCYYRYVRLDDKTNDLMKTLKSKGFEVKENVGSFIKSKTNAECVAVYHKTKNCAAYFVNTDDIKIYHGLISFISLLFPSLFSELPLRKPEDYDVILSLSKSDKNVFIEKIQNAVQPYITDFRRLMLGNLLRSIHESKIENALSSVNTQRVYISDIERTYANEIKKLKELIVVYEGMKVTECYDKPEEDLVEYLSTNKLIHNLSISNGRLIFNVATYLNNFNENAWDTFSKRGFIYDGKYKTNLNIQAFTDRDNRKILLDSIFGEDSEFVVKVAGNYILDLNSSYLQSSRGYDYAMADPIFKSYLPNPHLELFACLGGYKERVMRALRDGNYVAAIELCCASAGSVNLEETDQTFRPFIGWILNSREKILHRKDGVEMTPEEALIYLIDKEKANEAD